MKRRAGFRPPPASPKSSQTPRVWGPEGETSRATRPRGPRSAESDSRIAGEPGTRQGGRPHGALSDVRRPCGARRHDVCKLRRAVYLAPDIGRRTGRPRSCRGPGYGPRGPPSRSDAAARRELGTADLLRGDGTGRAEEEKSLWQTCHDGSLAGRPHERPCPRATTRAKVRDDERPRGRPRPHERVDQRRGTDGWIDEGSREA